MNADADDAAQPAGPVFRLIYRSHSLIAADDRRTELGAIFNTARRNNRGLGITGALVISDDAFVQALEGDEPAVRGLYATIVEDPRHDDLTVLDEQMVEAGRAFGRWAMAKVAADDGPDIRLLSNARKGAIVVAGPDPSITPEQEQVLAFMRKAMTMDAIDS